jgi:hypothetical protein
MKLLEKILKNTNDKYKNINKIVNFKEKYLINFIKNGNNIYLGLYLEEKLIIAGNFNFYGIYQPSSNLWIWASSIPGTSQKTLKNIRRIKKSYHLFESDSDPIINFYYQLLTQDIIMITDNQQLEWINELLLYLSNDIYYFNPINKENNNIQFITLADIKEKYN